MKKLLLAVEGDGEGERLDRFIARRGAISRGEARRLLDRGAVWVDDHRVKVASRQMHNGQRVSVFLEEAGRGEPRDMELGPERIIFEDQHLIAVDKPPFVPAQATLTNDRFNLLAMVCERVGRQVGLVHRLDLETSGVTVFGKTKAATTALAAAFRQGLARKRYLALAWGELPDEGRIDLALGSDPKRPGRFVASDRGVPAATRFHLLGRDGRLLAVELFPETGRTHQIRAHLTAMGAPLLGDQLYGGPSEVETIDGPRKAERVLLHASSLELPHPATGTPLTLAASLPEELQQWFRLATTVSSLHARVDPPTNHG